MVLETFPVKKARTGRILAALKRLYPLATCSLEHEDPWQLLVATILSAQCTDARVNKVTPLLFKVLPTTQDFAAAPLEKIERLIQSTGFYHNKAKSLQGAAAAIMAKHGGEVPRSMPELIALPGVGRKTANVVLGNAYGKNAGVVVDTHVGRISQLLGLTKENNPEKIERDLMKLVPVEDWTLWPHLLISHGRAICTARNPNCSKCGLFKECPAGPGLIKAKTEQGNKKVSEKHVTDASRKRPPR